MRRGLGGLCLSFSLWTLFFGVFIWFVCLICWVCVFSLRLSVGCLILIDVFCMRLLILTV